MGNIAKATVTIDAPAARVWDALVNPKTIKQYMFGTDVVSDWKKGGSITWKGEFQGKKYEDKGTILEIERERKLRYTHTSNLSPGEEHTVAIDLAPRGKQTVVSLSQDNNATEEARQHSEKNWEMMLAGLKKIVESSNGHTRV
jgi:uncharacterized protein YndB with AHSA1/START domain